MRIFLLASTCVALSLGCGGSNSGSGFSGGDDGGGASPGDGGDGTHGSDGGTALLGGDAAFSSDGDILSSCPEETQYVYNVTADNTLLRFDPPTLTFTPIGTLDCHSNSTPYSMAVDRTGQAWVVFADGNLFQVDTTTAACKSTSFKPAQHGFITFGMGFSSDTSGGTTDTLYVSDSGQQFDGTYDTTQGLAKIDATSLTLTPIGGYDAIQARAEMTGTGDARLFGAFEGSPYVVAEIDKTTAKILSQAPQTAINYPPDMSNFAFAFWGGDFWLFVGPGTSTDVFQYQPATGVTTKRTTVSYEIVGAGVSTCAPTQPPK